MVNSFMAINLELKCKNKIIEIIKSMGERRKLLFSNISIFQNYFTNKVFGSSFNPTDAELVSHASTFQKLLEDYEFFTFLKNKFMCKSLNFSEKF